MAADRCCSPRTPRREYVPVTLAGSVGDAAQALISFGYRDLLSPIALTAADARSAATASDPIRNVSNIVLIVSVLALGVWLLMRMRPRLPWAGAKAGRLRDDHAVGAQGPGAQRCHGRCRGTPAASRLERPRPSRGRRRLRRSQAGARRSRSSSCATRSASARWARACRAASCSTARQAPARRCSRARSRPKRACPFHHASGSDFVEKYVGVGARRVRDLFAQARRLGKGVIFIDEFDALGKSRGGAELHEEREQTLNQLLVEIDGFGDLDGHRRDRGHEPRRHPGRSAAPARPLLAQGARRPARRRRPAGASSTSTRAASRSPTDVDLELLARKTYGFSGAQLADLLNEAAIMAARRGGERSPTTTCTPAG